MLLCRHCVALCFTVPQELCVQPLNLGNLLPPRKNFRYVGIKVVNGVKISAYEFILGKACEMFSLLVSLIHTRETHAMRNSGM